MQDLPRSIPVIPLEVYKLAIICATPLLKINNPIVSTASSIASVISVSLLPPHPIVPLLILKGKKLPGVRNPVMGLESYPKGRLKGFKLSGRPIIWRLSVPLTKLSSTFSVGILEESSTLMAPMVVAILLVP